MVLKALLGSVALPLLLLVTGAAANDDNYVYGTNVIVNGDFETGDALVLPVEPETDTTPQQIAWAIKYAPNVTSIPGWDGEATLAAYGPAFADCNGFLNQWQKVTQLGLEDVSGKAYAMGGSTTCTSLSQTYTFPPSLACATNLQYTLSADVGGFFNEDDYAVVKVEFYSDANPLPPNWAPFSSSALPIVTSTQRYGQPVTLYEEVKGSVPANTSRAVVSVHFHRVSGLWNDGAVDNIKLSFSS